jgi:hypothetical protein
MNPIKIKPIQIESNEAHFVEAKPINESLVIVNFYNADVVRIASRLLLIPADEELSDEIIWRIAGVELA